MPKYTIRHTYETKWVTIVLEDGYPTMTVGEDDASWYVGEHEGNEIIQLPEFEELAKKLYNTINDLIEEFKRTRV